MHHYIWLSFVFLTKRMDFYLKQVLLLSFLKHGLGIMVSGCWLPLYSGVLLWGEAGLRPCFGGLVCKVDPAVPLLESLAIRQ